MLTSKKKEVKVDLFAIRLKEDEQARYQTIVERARARNPWITQADINRLLISLAIDHSVITPEDIAYFASGEILKANRPPIKKTHEPRSNKPKSKK